MLKVKADFLFYLIGFIFIVMFYSLYMSYKEEEIKNYVFQSQQEQSKPQLLYFGATWCGPCQKMKEMFEQKEIKSQLDKLAFKKYDVDVDTGEKDKWAIKLVPTIITIDKEGKIKRYTGLLKKDEFFEILSKLSN